MPGKRNTSELIFSEDLTKGDIVKVNMEMYDNLSQDNQDSQKEITTDIPITSKKITEEEQFRTLFHAAMMLQTK